MQKKTTVLDLILGFAVIGLILLAISYVGKLSEYFVEIINPEFKYRELYLTLGIVLTFLLTGLSFFGLSVKLKDDSLPQRISSVLLYINALAFLACFVYLIYLLLNLL